MKTIVGALLTFSSILAGTSIKAQAQEQSYAVPVSSGTYTTTASATAAPVGVSSKIFNEFNRRFSTATEAKWNPSGEVTTVYFKQNGITSRAIFSASGSLEYTLRTYYGVQVPEKVVNLLRRNGYNMHIMQSTEVVKRNVSTHVVKLEDENQYVSVRVHQDGEITEFESFQKAK